MPNHLRLRVLFSRTLPFFLLFLLFQLFVEFLLLHHLLFSESRNRLEDLTKRLSEDVVFRNGNWDLSLYDSDSSLPSNSPIYIIAANGLVIDRSHLIRGLLDFSRYSLITAYSSPTTIEEVPSEKWRVLSSSVDNESQSVGVVYAAIYQPETKDLSVVDKRLREIVSQIKSNISVNGDTIDVSKLDQRQIPFDVSFQIINRFNKVLVQSDHSSSVNRLPTYIDRSYIDSQLKAEPEKEVEDVVTHNRFLTMTTPVYDEKKVLAGMIVTGIPIDFIYSSSVSYILFSLMFSLMIGTITLLSYNYYLYKVKSSELNNKNVLNIQPKSITFMKKACKLAIDEQMIDIPYSSYQYYFCSSLFSKPQKKWEVDELLDAFGEDIEPNKWRKVYDTMIALNKKTAPLINKLFMVQDKRYFINTKAIPLIRVI